MQKRQSPLRNARRARTINQAELSRLVGITQQSLSKAERGTLRLSFDVQMRIAAILGATRQELFPESEAVAS
jgi:transcriptional regulator with XRE-family HTH domain